MKRILSTIVFVFLFLQIASAQHEGLTFYVDGENLRRVNKFDDAIKKFNQALQKEPTNHKYLYAKAQCEFRLRQDDAAMQTLAGAVKANESFVEAYILMAEIAKVNAKMNDACRYYDQAFVHEKNVDKKIDYKFFVMNKLIKEKNIAAAFEKVKEAKEASNLNESVLYYYAKLGNILGKYGEAKEAVLSIATRMPTMKPEDASKFYFELGYAYFHLEEYPNADATFKKITVPSYTAKAEKFTPKYFCSLALTYFKFHENTLSKQYVDKAVKIQHGYPLAHVLLAQLSKRNNDHKTTIAHLESAVSHEKNVMRKVDLYDKIADMQLELGQYDLCIATIHKSLDLKSDDNEAIFTRNLVFYKKNEFQSCVAGVNEALRKPVEEAKKAEFNFLLGLSYKKLNDKTKAKAAFYSATTSSLKDAAELEIENLVE
jgi:tetratricopeptide (TPR) repeat protein